MVTSDDVCSRTRRKLCWSADSETSAQLGRVCMENFCWIEDKWVSHSDYKVERAETSVRRRLPFERRHHLVPVGSPVGFTVRVLIIHCRRARTKTLKARTSQK